MNIDWNAIVNKIVDLIAPVLVTLVKSVLSADFFFIMLATIGATYILKQIIKYGIKDPNKALIWFALTPLVSLFFSYLTWNGSDSYDWVVVGFAASPASNVLFWFGLSVLKRIAPAVADKIQNPIHISVTEEKKDENPPS